MESGVKVKLFVSIHTRRLSVKKGYINLMQMYVTGRYTLGVGDLIKYVYSCSGQLAESMKPSPSACQSVRLFQRQDLIFFMSRLERPKI